MWEVAYYPQLPLIKQIVIYVILNVNRKHTDDMLWMPKNHHFGL